MTALVCEDSLGRSSWGDCYSWSDLPVRISVPGHSVSSVLKKVGEVRQAR